MAVTTRPPPPPRRSKPSSPAEIHALQYSPFEEDVTKQQRISGDVSTTERPTGPRNESSILFGLDAYKKTFRAGGPQNLQHSFVGKLPQPTDLHSIGPDALEEYRRIVREALTHDVKVWRERRARAYRAWYVPHVMEPVGMGVLVSLLFLLPSLPLPGDMRAQSEQVLSVLVAILGALMVAHRLSVDPTGKARGYIGRLDRAISMVDGYRAQLDLQDTVSVETIEFVTKACKVVHSVLRPDEPDL